MSQERKLSDEQRKTYIEHNRQINLAAAKCLEVEADLEVARAESKRAAAKAMAFHAELTAEYHIESHEVIDEASGLINPKKVQQP